MHYAQVLPTVLTIVALSYMGFLVSRNSRQLTNRLFLLFVIIDSLWLAFVAVINTSEIGSNVYLGRAVFAAAVLLLMSTLIFINKLLGFVMARKAAIIVYSYGILLFLLTILTPRIILGVKTGTDPAHLNPYPIYGMAFPLYLAYVLVMVGTYCYVLLNRNKVLSHRKDITRQQLDIVAWGLGLFVVISVLTNLALPALFSSPWPSEFAPLGSLMLAASFFYAIGKYKLFDIRTAIARGTTYVFVFTGLALGFVLTASVFNSHIVNGFQDKTAGLVFNTIAALIVGVSFQPLKRVFDKVTNRFFFRDVYNTQNVITELNKILIANTNITTMLVLCEDLFMRSMKLEFCFLGLFGQKGKPRIFGQDADSLTQEEYMYIAQELADSGERLLNATTLSPSYKKLRKIFERKGISATTLFGLQNERLGFAIFGDRKNGNALSSQDLGLIDTAMSQIAIATQSALRFEEIENFNITLQQKVEEATHKLRRTNDKLRQLDETKDDFISMASHQLRTPLTSVKGYVSMVLDGDGGTLSPLQRKLLSQSFISAQRMVYLISDLLNVSRLRTGRFIVEPVPTNLAHIVQEEVHQLVETAKSRDLELTFHRPEHFPTLLLDETKLRQVIMNFIDNAIYYTPSGGHIVVELVDKPQSIEFTVNDDGMGVPRSEQHHLFSKFYRAENAKRARPDGTGLGLFMAKKVIAVQGGAIIFKSSEGKGSTFGFTFAKAPLLVPDAAEKKHQGSLLENRHAKTERPK